MASTAALAARRALALDRLRTAADVAQARGQLAIGEPASTKDAEINRIQWVEYAANVLEALNAQPAPQPQLQPEPEPAAEDDETKTKRKR
jgi:hypothetical protein